MKPNPFRVAARNSGANSVTPAYQWGTAVFDHLASRRSWASAASVSGIHRGWAECGWWSLVKNQNSGITKLGAWAERVSAARARFQRSLGVTRLCAALTLADLRPGQGPPPPRAVLQPRRDARARRRAVEFLIGELSFELAARSWPHAAQHHRDNPLSGLLQRDRAGVRAAWRHSARTRRRVPAARARRVARRAGRITRKPSSLWRRTRLAEPPLCRRVARARLGRRGGGRGRAAAAVAAPADALSRADAGRAGGGRPGRLRGDGRLCVALLRLLASPRGATPGGGGVASARRAHRPAAELGEAAALARAAPSMTAAAGWRRRRGGRAFALGSDGRGALPPRRCGRRDEAYRRAGGQRCARRRGARRRGGCAGCALGRRCSGPRRARGAGVVAWASRGRRRRRHRLSSSRARRRTTSAAVRALLAHMASGPTPPSARRRTNASVGARRVAGAALRRASRAAARRVQRGGAAPHRLRSTCAARRQLGRRRRRQAAPQASPPKRYWSWARPTRAAASTRSSARSTCCACSPRPERGSAPSASRSRRDTLAPLDLRLRRHMDELHRLASEAERQTPPPPTLDDMHGLHALPHGGGRRPRVIERASLNEPRVHAKYCTAMRMPLLVAGKAYSAQRQRHLVPGAHIEDAAEVAGAAGSVESP